MHFKLLYSILNSCLEAVEEHIKVVSKMIRIGLATSIKVVGHFNCIEVQVINKLAAGTEAEGHKGCIKVD